MKKEEAMTTLFFADSDSDVDVDVTLITSRSNHRQ